MACADVDMNIHRAAEEPGGADHGEAPNIWRYQAVEVIPDKRGPLHDLLQKQPAAFGIMSGLVSLGLGIIFALEQQMEYSLIILFRVSYMSGLLFIIAGFISILLFKYPQLLQISLMVNCSCIVVALIAICLITVDVTHGRLGLGREKLLQLVLLELYVLVFKVLLSAILCVCFSSASSKKNAQNRPDGTC